MSPSPRSPKPRERSTDLKQQTALYAIIDTVTDSIIGGVQLHRNDQSAIRMAFDVATGDTMVNKHPLDFQLRRLGILTPQNQIIAEDKWEETLLTGEQFATIVQSAKET